jgi:nicotinamide-nucleotide amidase
VAVEVIDEAVKKVTSVLGNDVYSTDGLKLEAVVGELLVCRGFRIAVAESCTGGLISSRLTDVPGSSRYVDQGIVSYSNEAKTSLLNVPEALIENEGAVSSSVALAMAQGIRIRAGVHVGVGVTGIAGPDGGSDEKPVGTVAFAVVLPDRSETRMAQFVGERVLVKSQASQAALDMVRRLLLGLPSVSENNSKFSFIDQTN